MTGAEAAPRYRGAFDAVLPAVRTLRGLEPSRPEGRTHGHDFTARFVFETTALVYPGVVVDADIRDEVNRHVTDRLAYRDLDRLLGRPPTCEAIAEHLARWFVHSARPPGDATLLSIAVTTGSGEHGEIILPVTP